MTLTEAALEWAADGIPVFPCAHNKRPITENGFYDATTDPTQVKFLFDNAPADCTIGGRMGADSGLFAIDFDIYKPGEAGRSAQQFMAELIAKGILPDSQRHATMNGGLHIIYASDVQPNTKPVQGVEVKGEGGYIILPPSRGYKIEQDVGFREAPKALVEVLLRSTRKHQNKTIEDHEQAIISGTDFHDSLTSIAAKMFKRGASNAEVSDRLLRALQASLARADTHPRHERWSALVSDASGELSRIVNSGYSKYSPNAGTDAFRDHASQEENQRRQAVADAFGFASPPSEETPREEAAPTFEEGEWPFEGEGYFAGQELTITDQQFHLYPLFAENETVVVAADPKAGKTAIALKLATHVAAGVDLGPFKVTEPKACLYYALEGTRAIKLRMEAEKRRWTDENETALPDDLPLFVVERPTNFVSEKASNAAKCVAASKYFESTMGKTLGLIIIDTFTKAMPGADQNSVDDTSALFEFVTMLRAEGVKATVVFIHHTGKDGKTRGSTNIEAEPDVVLKMRKVESTTQMYVHMARSIDDNRTYNFILESYDLGNTDQGINQTAPVVTLVGGTSDDPEDTENLRHAHERNKYLPPIIELGDGKHTIPEVVLAWKKAKAITPRAKPSVIHEILSSLFDTSMEIRFGGKTIIAEKDEAFTALLVQD